ncbi:hypothetical protein [Nocardioides campestrisoli]|uniref:hypothetical protein n=1 Tax=Nocardioides campestrisoli TaxID=2736757 RepID=UPI0015E78087|nr:hypothetical protein [Nocardioides campestrisoli]
MRNARWVDALVPGLVALVVLGPLLAPGFVLVGDMVFVPEQPWKDAWTGGDGGVPRAVPSDAWVSLLGQVVPGDLLQKLVLVGIVLGAGLGVAHLLRDLPALARAGGMLLYCWNPFLHERLGIGHWALLVGYAALPWVAAGALRLRETAWRSGAVCLIAGLAVAGWASPTGGVLTVLVALALVRGWGTRLLVGLLGVWVNLPWILPALLNGADQLPPDAFGVEAFASRADTPWGVLVSVATFGGIWKEAVVPDDRGTPLLAGVGVLVVLLSVLGLRLARRRPVLPLPAAVLLGVGPVLLASLSAFEPTRPLLEWVVVHVPGGGLLRDSQKLVMPWVLVAATGFASLLASLHGRLARFGEHARWWLGTVVLLPAVALPSLAAGLSGFLTTSDFPDEWAQVRGVMEDEGVDEERVLVLPFSTYRRFDWTPRTILDPAPRFFPGSMVTEDALAVESGTVGGESALASRVRSAQGAEELAGVLARAGVGWVLVHETPEEVVLPSGAVPVVQGEQLSLYRVPGAAEATVADSPRAAWYAGIDLAVLLSTVAGLGVAARVSRKRACSCPQEATDAYS